MNTRLLKGKWLTVGIILLFLGTCIIPTNAQRTEKSTSTSTSRGNWLYVGGSGPGNYTRIQDAIDSSSDGDTIYVFDESSPYIENIKVYKEIHLVGEDKNSTELRGLNPNDVVIAITTADFVTISGFTITTETSNVGIKIFSSFNTISGNIFIDNSTTSETYEIGIQLTSSSLLCTIKDNIFQNTNKGIHMQGSSFNTISNNCFDTNRFGIISFCGREHTIDNNTMKNSALGMLLSCFNASIIVDNVITSCINGIQIGTHCSNNLILRNTIGLCGSSIDVSLLSYYNKIQNNTIVKNYRGISISTSCDYTLIENNEFLQNTRYGIRIHSTDNKVHFNVIKDNIEVGIFVNGKHNNISYNVIENNGIGVYLQYAKQNMITCNNFIKNRGFFMYSLKTLWYNRWDSNYWDSLNGNIKVIFGRLRIVLFSWTDWLDRTTHEIAIYPLLLNVDWHPAQEPYDILGIS
jgi:parallel beta-helix repeat protein